MSEPHAPQANGPGANGGKKTLKIHRVCIGCNNMFEVTMENYEAKHCPVCHKG
jgi:rRNA maturation endonuclease Nob1